MASSCIRLCLVVLVSSLFMHAIWGSLGGEIVVCEDLAKEECAFSIGSWGKRCVLETDGKCRSSEVVVESMSHHIETDECVKACGVHRISVGISSDALLDPHFTVKLCSSPCYNNCPNIVDLYCNLAAGEGVFLPDLCEKQRISPHRAMIELMNSGAAPGPVSDVSEDLQPVAAPSPR